MKKLKSSSPVLFFTKFPKLFLGGILFSIPFAIFSGLFLLIGYLTGFNNIIVGGLGIIPSAMFYSGLVMVIRKISVEKKDINVIETFFTAVKENYKKSLINGVIAYAITACSFFAILYYSSLADENVVFGAVLMLYIIFTVCMVIMMFYVPLLTITYELKIKDIYKNSLLLIVGKILRNIITLFLVALVSAVAFLGIIFAEGVFLYLVIGLIILLYPVVAAYIINSVIAKGVQESVGYFTGDNVNYYLTEEEQEKQDKAVENADSNSDYIFVNGKMIKNPAKSKE
ncbi:MAG: DUF624 domain-containing protein [Oscillospiraceae bacterium]|nr:DUF624 domain-containing protein [Oscillospiraceae bacterium]